MEFHQEQLGTPSQYDADDLFGSDFESEDEESDNISNNPLILPHLPYEVLENIVRFCDTAQLFNFTRVNSTFRRLAYNYISRVTKIPWYEPLALHLLNNQKPQDFDVLSPEVYIRAMRVRVVVSQNGSRIIQHRGVWNGSPEKIDHNDREGRGKLYAPRFELKDYCPSWSRDWWILHLRNGGPWVMGMNEDVNFVLMGIYRRRRLRTWLRGPDKRI